MGKPVPQKTVVIVFALGLPRGTLTALDPRKSKVIGNPILIPQTICRGANGSAEEVNQ